MDGLLKQNLVSDGDILVSEHRSREGERLVEKYIFAMYESLIWNTRFKKEMFSNSHKPNQITYRCFVEYFNRRRFGNILSNQSSFQSPQGKFLPVTKDNKVNITKNTSMYLLKI